MKREREGLHLHPRFRSINDPFLWLHIYVSDSPFKPHKMLNF